MGDGFEVISFKENPNLETATSYLKTRGFYRNSGMFPFRAGRHLQEMQVYRPDIYQSCTDSIANARVDPDFMRVDADAF